MVRKSECKNIQEQSTVTPLFHWRDTHAAWWPILTRLDSILKMAAALPAPAFLPTLHCKQRNKTAFSPQLPSTNSKLICINNHLTPSLARIKRANSRRNERTNRHWHSNETVAHALHVNHWSLISMTELCLLRQRTGEWKPPPCCYWILYSIPVSRASKFASFKFVMHTAPRAVEYRSRLFMNRQTSGGWWDVRNTI